MTFVSAWDRYHAGLDGSEGSGQGGRDHRPGLLPIAAADLSRAPETGLALLFPAEARPSAAAVVAAIAEPGGPVPIVPGHAPSPPTGTLELVAQGLAFDLTGLAEAPPLPPPPVRHRVGLDDVSLDGLATVLVRPGLHLQAAANLLPVVRVQAAIAARLASLPGARAACWLPAATAIAPASFASTVASWLAGGPFPALAFTALVADPDGALHSQGLSFFTGQELHIAPHPGRSARDSARIAIRLIDELAGADPLRTMTRFTGPAGEPLVATPDGEYEIIRIYSEA